MSEGGLRRGFKAWCEKTAAHYRRQVGARPQEPLCPWAFAQYLRATILIPEDIDELGETVKRQLLKVDPGSWSAVTIKRPKGICIILNSAHVKARQANDLMHELAHVVLDHKPSRLDVSESGLLILTHYDRGQEAEADWLSSTLLLPREALLLCLKRRLSVDQIAEAFGVSSQLVKMRINLTGVRLQIRRARGSASR